MQQYACVSCTSFKVQETPVLKDFVNFVPVTIPRSVRQNEAEQLSSAEEIKGSIYSKNHKEELLWAAIISLIPLSDEH